MYLQPFILCSCCFQISKPVGRVRNELVIIDRIGIGSPNLTDKKLLQDLRIMKEIKHENLNDFIGICFEQNHIYTLMSFATRGSLKNVLEVTEDLSMDIQISLLHDIAQGLRYLHSSEISRLPLLFDSLRV